MPSLTQLQYIVAVDEHRHFGLASKSQNVSQPSLSQQIQKAEEDLGVIIFDRTVKPIRVTEAGRKVIQQARQVLNEHQRLLEIRFEKEGVLSGQLKLAVIPTLSPYLIPLFLRSFSESHPKVQLEISELQTSAIIKLLHEEKIDAALLATPLHERGLTELPLFYEPFLLYHSPKHPSFKKSSVSLSDLKSEKAWVLSDGHCFGTQMKSYCSLHSENPVMNNVHFQGGSFETLQNLVDDSESYTLFPKLFVSRMSRARRQNQVKPFRSPVPSREISLVFKRKVWKQEIIEALKEKIILSLPEEIPRTAQKIEVIQLGSD